MARASTTSDVFNAIAEPARRAILDALRPGEMTVTAIVNALGFGQPQVSKHLKVLREVGLVASRVHGRERMYRVNAAPLHEINVWSAQFEALWNERLDRLDDVLADLQQTPPQIRGNP